jgi:biofilm PGA synthesis N-glycosyltransferase PgaC
MAIFGSFSVLDVLQLACYFVMIYASVLFLTVYITNRGKFSEKTPPAKNLPPVTILVPAFNEEKHIYKCLKACLSLNYPKDKLKIICINDGSTDNTLAEIKRIKDKRIMILNKKNTGKADCLNYALKFVKTEFVSTMDADSFPSKNYLKLGMGQFVNDKIVAVSPALKLSTTKTLMQKIQWMEYVFSIYLRKLFAILDCQYVLPGPGSIYKTSVLKEVGGWDRDSLVEDTELAFRLQEKGYKMENSIASYVYTEAPRSFKALFDQRIRWYRGYLQTTMKYAKMIGRPKYGNLGLYVLPVNIIWYFVMSFMFFLPAYLLIKDVYERLYVISLIGLELPKLTLVFDILSISSFSYYMLFFFAVGISVMFISLHSSAEKTNLGARKVHYLGYLFIYPILYTIFWLSAILFELLKLEKKW